MATTSAPSPSNDAIGGLRRLRRTSGRLFFRGISGFLITPDDHAALATHFERLLADEVLRERMGAAASMRAQHFGWSAVASNIVHIYRDTLERTTLGQTLTIQPRAAA